MLDEADPQSFRVRAYESAAQAIAAQGTDLGQLTAKELQQHRGHRQEHRGEDPRALSTAARSQRLEELRAKHPASVGRPAAHPGPRAEGRHAGCAPSSASSRSTISARRSRSTRLRDLKGFGAKSEEKLAHALARLDEQGSLDAHAHLGRAAARRAHRRARCARSPASRTPRTAARSGASRRRSATSTSSSRRPTPRPVMDALVGDERRRSRARARRDEDERRHAPRHADRSARRRGPTSSARRCSISRAPRVTTSSCGSARSTRGWTLNEYAPRRGRRRQGRRERDRRADLRGARPAVDPAGPARGRGRDRGRREGRRCPRPLGRVLGDFHVHTTLSGDGRSSLEEVVAAAKAPRLPLRSRSPITPKARSPAWAARRSLEQRAQIEALRAASSATRSRCSTASS